METATNPKVILHSDEYEDEEFFYDTIEEARAGMKRLATACRREYRKDRIEREINLVVETIMIGN
jgi:hypothetical protein